jgi:hypothetical protein
VSVKNSATPKATAAINHAIHGIKAASRPLRLPRRYLPKCRHHTTRCPRSPEFVAAPIGVLVAEVNLHPRDSLAEAGQGLQNLVPHALHEIGDGVDVLIRVRQDLHRS